MRTLIIVLYVACTLFFYYCGWLLTFRTSPIVKRAHSQYHCNFFLKPWYSTLMRFIGIFIWMGAGLIDWMLVTRR